MKLITVKLSNINFFNDELTQSEVTFIQTNNYPKKKKKTPITSMYRTLIKKDNRMSRQEIIDKYFGKAISKTQ